MFDSRKQNHGCGFGEQIVSFIYDEMNEPDQATFEKHLADCPACSDEVAAFTSLSFAIQDWRDTEFADLPTPKIEIPYDSARPAVEVSKETKSSWFDNFRGIFSPVFVKTATAFGVLAISLGLVWFLAFNHTEKIDVAEEDTREEKIESPVTPQNAENSSPDKIEIVDLKENKPELTDEEKAPANEIVKQTPEPVKVKQSAPVKTNYPRKKSVRKKPEIADNSPKSKSKPIEKDLPDVEPNQPNNLELRQAPRLTELAVEDTDDDDLRLSDLFTDVDSDR